MNIPGTLPSRTTNANLLGLLGVRGATGEPTGPITVRAYPPCARFPASVHPSTNPDIVGDLTRYVFVILVGVVGPGGVRSACDGPGEPPRVLVANVVRLWVDPDALPIVAMRGGSGFTTEACKHVHQRPELSLLTSITLIKHNCRYQSVKGGILTTILIILVILVVSDDSALRLVLLARSATICVLLLLFPLSFGLESS